MASSGISRWHFSHCIEAPYYCLPFSHRNPEIQLALDCPRFFDPLSLFERSLGWRHFHLYAFQQLGDGQDLDLGIVSLPALRSVEASRHHKYTHISSTRESLRAVRMLFASPQSGSPNGNMGHNTHSRGSIQSTPVNSVVEELLGVGDRGL